MPMTARPDDQPALRAPETGPKMRVIATSRDWTLAEYVCEAGPGDRCFEERHEVFTIAAVTEGTFRYKADTGTSLMHPGSWLLGNYGSCFECGHDHSRGDRCLAFHMRPDYFAEIASSAGGSASYRFEKAMLPATGRSLSLMARAQSIVGHNDAFQIDETVTALLEDLVTATSGAHPTQQTVSARDERRVSAALHLIEDDFAEALDLDDLAAAAGMSKYHFIRTFRSIVGRSPHQYLLGIRLRHVAERLMSTADAITDIALSCGFGDISTFVSQFKRQFGETPTLFRARHG
jgi:AraC-like DNA-binding protein